MNCLEPEEALSALEGDGSAAGHATECPACAELVSDMGRVRILVRQVGPECWAPLPRLDVEVALQRVRARAVPGPSRGASPRVPQVLSAAAAALLLCALVGPYALRQRVDRPARDEFRPGREGAIFWTSRHEDLALTRLVGAGVR